jgi:hypothetical protein
VLVPQTWGQVFNLPMQQPAGIPQVENLRPRLETCGHVFVPQKWGRVFNLPMQQPAGIPQVENLRPLLKTCGHF